MMLTCQVVSITPPGNPEPLTSTPVIVLHVFSDDSADDAVATRGWNGCAHEPDGLLRRRLAAHDASV